MSDTNTKARIVTFLTKQRDRYEFNEGHFERTPDLDEALDELRTEGRIRRFISTIGGTSRSLSQESRSG